MLVRKVCMVGDFAVGKTSLVSRFVHSTFSDRYLSTVGVKIDTRSIDVNPQTQVKLVIWDIAGTDGLSTIESHYLQGAAGLILVADGTRAHTLDTAIGLGRQTRSLIGSKPTLLLLNKADLTKEWEVKQNKAEEFPTYLCSARTGDGVEDAFTRLAEQLAT